MLPFASRSSSSNAGKSFDNVGYINPRNTARSRISCTVGDKEAAPTVELIMLLDSCTLDLRVSSAMLGIDQHDFFVMVRRDSG